MHAATGFAALAVVVGSGCTPLTWGPQPHSSVGIPLSHVTMVSPRVGWALRLNQFDGLRAVLRTVDGGRRWTDVTLGGIVGAPTSIAGAGTSRAWLAVERLRTRRSTVAVWATADGGSTWTPGAAVRAGATGSLQFVSPSAGWLTLDDGAAAGSTALRVLATRDGGRH